MNSIKRSCWGGVCAVLLGLTFAIAAAAQVPPRPERPGLMQQRDHELMLRALEPQATSSAGTIYVETFGTDSSRCGAQRLPCHTINYGVYRAQQLQREGSVQVVTIQVGPGTYTERVSITSGWLRLQGAGAGASSITNSDDSAVVLEAAQGILITGFTISAKASAVVASNGASVWVSACELRDSREGLRVQFNSFASVYSTTFNNNRTGAHVCHLSYVELSNVQITGKSANEGTGFLLCDGAVGSIQYSRISQTRFGMSLLNSEVYSFWDVQISGNDWGIYAVEDSLLEMGDTTISNNTGAGLGLHSSSVAVLFGPTISNNSTGIDAYGNSYLELNAGQVSNNGTGIAFDVFAHGLLRSVSYSGNGTDLVTSRGGGYVTE